MVTILDDSESDKDVPKKCKQLPTSAIKKESSKRAPKTAVSENKSVGRRVLPKWAVAKWESTFMPSLLTLIGAHQKPWQIEKVKDESTYLEICQSLVEAVWPDIEHQVVKKDAIFRVVSAHECLLRVNRTDRCRFIGGPIHL